MTVSEPNTKARTAPKQEGASRNVENEAYPASWNGSAELVADKSARELVYRTCLALDKMDFKAYMEMCDPAYRYVISAYSPELRKDIIWLDHDWNGMNLLFEVLPKHVSDNLIRLHLSRHATVYTVDYDADQSRANVTSSLQVFTTTLDGGVTELLGVGMYHDTVNMDGPRPLLLSREVRLETRMLGETGSHIPF